MKNPIRIHFVIGATYNRPPKKEHMDKEIEQSYKDNLKRNLAVIAQELENQHHLILEPRVVYDMAVAGLSERTICRLYRMDNNTILDNPELLYEYNRGRAQIGSQVRTSIVDDALNKDLPYAKIHLDKIYNKEDSVQQIDVNVTQKPLENISTEQLLSIEVDDDKS
jgi:hypothetical protein